MRSYPGHPACHWQKAVALGAAIALAIVTAVVPGRLAQATRTPGDAAQVERILTHMTLAQRVGQMFMFSFPGTTPSPNLITMVRDWGVGGLILYRPNVVSGPQVRALIAGAQHAARVPLLISTDEEGGAGSMIPQSDGVHALLSPATYGRLDSAARVYRDAASAGRDLRALGVMMNLAPVLDVLIDPQSPIGTRSYGANPAVVASLGAAAIKGYQSAGIAATAKHFLGLGGVSIDAHQGFPTVQRSRQQLDQVELEPMRTAIRAGVDALMVTHAAIPALDPSGTAASLSRPIITGFIRGALGYRGLIISDSLAMGAIDTRISVVAASVQAAAAGTDIILISSYEPIISAAVMHQAMIAVEQAVLHHRLNLATIDDATRHVLTLKAKLGLLESTLSQAR
jgi:beta-N-acetylhexosaminidase